MGCRLVSKENHSKEIRNAGRKNPPTLKKQMKINNNAGRVQLDPSYVKPPKKK